MELFTPILIAVLLIVGSAIHYFSGKPDTCAEELVEEVLRVEGVTVDFSAAEHKAAQDAQKTKDAEKAKAVALTAE